MKITEPAIEVRSSPFGKGLFALQDIQSNEFICTIDGPVINFADTLKLKEKESHAVQTDADLYIICQPPFLYTNHSCDPNSGINSSLQLIALRDIKKDEEIFWDYSTSMLERHWTMKCACGNECCRKIITDFDLLPIHVQQYYLTKGIVFPFIVQYLQLQWRNTG
jgi:hypothetical protein